MSLQITPATQADVPTILAFIRELADYEKLLDQCVATEADLLKTLFGPRPVAQNIIARLDGVPVGHAIFFYNYSTFLAKPGVYLEDLYVQPHARGKGVGKALLNYLVQYAHDNDFGRLEWTVLDWNQPAIDFYEAFGATVMPDWRICRMTRADMETRLSR